MLIRHSFCSLLNKFNQIKIRDMKQVVGLFLAAFLGGFASVTVYDHYKDTQDQGNYVNLVGDQNMNAPGNVHYTSNRALAPEAKIDFTGAAETSTHAVVHVKTTYTASNHNYYDPFRDFFGYGQPQRQPQKASGSGVIISDDGYIVTNNHVVRDASEIEVVLNDKRTYKAQVIGLDPTTDLALLKVEEKELPYIPFGNSDDLKVGEWVLAVGNPFNLNSTVTAGIVSAKGRNINILQEEFAIESFIQTDAAVNPGNSGGALVNTEGALIGINTAIASTTGSYAGYSFAVPANIVSKVVSDLMEYGTVQRAFIGVSIRDIDASLADATGIRVQDGVYVMGLSDGGAAADAGIEAGDIITSVGNSPTRNVPELQEIVARYRPGDQVSVNVLRDGKQKTLPVVLRNKKGTTEKVAKVENTALAALGAEFGVVSKREMQQLRIDGGVKVAKLQGGKLRSAGIKEGFIITKVDKKKVNTAEEVISALENRNGGVLIEGVYPNGYRSYYGFGL